MKVISIKEPYATLIMHNHKTIETRSWQTSYRGELYIHASGKQLMTELLNGTVTNLMKDLPMHYGNIICKVNLVDCVYMDEAFIQKIKHNPTEYACGKYEVGRYAWILQDIEVITPIPAKGKLKIWNYYCE